MRFLALCDCAHRNIPIGANLTLPKVGDEKLHLNLMARFGIAVGRRDWQAFALPPGRYTFQVRAAACTKRSRAAAPAFRSWVHELEIDVDDPVSWLPSARFL